MVPCECFKGVAPALAGGRGGSSSAVAPHRRRLVLDGLGVGSEHRSRPEQSTSKTGPRGPCQGRGQQAPAVGSLDRGRLGRTMRPSSRVVQTGSVAWG